MKYRQSADSYEIVLDKTPFYAESGGQIGDIGTISNDNFTFIVSDTYKYGDDICHYGYFEKGKIKKDFKDKVNVKINPERRNFIKKNHTATHLLHKALKIVLGNDVQQAGSLVSYNYLRFDLTYYKKINQSLISDYKKKAVDSLIDLKFETSISNEIILGPLIVKNHINNSNEIVVQDSENILYLINNLGQVEWTKKIDGKIIREINQIDSYKNGKLQLAFVTKKSLYMLDRKGRDVGKFPLKFNDSITKPLSVFDYDNNKNYRLLITQDNELYMFDSKGNIIRGFNYDKKGRIITKPKHFRISNKDIIVFKTNDELTILNRRGKVRIKTKRKYNFSENEIFQYKNFLVSTTNLNEVIKIDMQGNTFLEKPIANNIKLASEKKSIFTLDRNILSNTKNNIEIAFGKYEDFKIYLGNDKSFINIFDSQNNKTYLTMN